MAKNAAYLHCFCIIFAKKNMATNKIASYRYRLIDTCLRHPKREWSLPDLQEWISDKLYEEFDIETGISERQLLGDIALMRKDPPQGFGAKIVRKNNRVWYADKDFSIVNHPLIESDFKALKETLQLLKQFRELPHFQEVQEVYQKLKGVLLGSRELAGNPVILFDKNELLKGLEFIQPLFQYIQRQQSLVITYHPFYLTAATERNFHPYLLKAYNNRWFVLGWSGEEDCPMVLALDRIKVIQQGNFTYLPDKIPNLPNYFDHVVGVTVPVDESPVDIQLKVHPQQLPYIVTKPIHASQRVEHQIISLYLIPNYELKALLLGFGSRVEVLSPVSLREEMIALLRESLGNYIK
ncbi:MAG: putative DNA-binding transcriptional regulator YafY [Saprospiraceae bacterium]|jgi:predicted DNA-binding transcriptional regulator YafY